MHFGKIVGILVASCAALTAESRFGLPVASLENSKAFHSLDLTGNAFAMTQRGSVVVATLVYGGPARYFVDVAVSNRGTKPITLADDFVRFHKNGTAVPSFDTRVIAADLQRSIGSTGKVVSVNYTGNVKAMMERAAAAKEREEKEKLVTHLSAFAHEKQSLELAPGKMTLYTFVFNAPDREKMGFELCVVAGEDSFDFEYKK